MNFASPRLAASGQSLLRATLVNSGADQATAAPTELGELPSWRLTDLYLSPSSEEFRSDLAKAEADAIAFEAKWKGKLKEAAGRTGDQGIGAAVKEFEALDDLMGRIASFAGLTYFSDTSNPANGKLYGDVQSKLTDISAHLLFFSLELNRIDDKVIDDALTTDSLAAHYRPGFWTCARTSPISSTTGWSSFSSKSR